jgi:uncharacterized protein
MNIDISRLLQNDGATEEFQLNNVLDHITISGQDYPVRQIGSMDVRLKNKGNSVIVISYSGDSAVTIPCARCLEPVEYPVKFEGTREIDMKIPDDERDDESFFVIEKEIYPDLLFMDEIMQQWPIRVLCKPDCKGICSQCGANLNETVCNCEKEVTDPRMAAIRDIFSQYKEV